MLDLEYNQLKELPNQIELILKNIEHLNLQDNHLTTIPSEIGSLTNLKKLNLSRNMLKTLPSSIFTLSQLSHLNFQRNLTTATTRTWLTQNLKDIIQLTKRE